MGGDNYTFEDLRRDLLYFEEENKSNKKIDDLAARKSCEIEDKIALDHQSIIEQILQELVNEEKEIMESNQSNKIKGAQENLE